MESCLYRNSARARLCITLQVTNTTAELEFAAAPAGPEDVHQDREAYQEDQPSRLQDIDVPLPRGFL